MLENISPVKKMDYYIHSNTLILEELISEGSISHVTENWYKPSHVLLHLVAQEECLILQEIIAAESPVY